MQLYSLSHLENLKNTCLLLMLDKCRTIASCHVISRELIIPKVLHGETSYCMWWSCLTTSNSLHPCPYLDTCKECTVSMCAYVPGKNHQVSLKENGKTYWESRLRGGKFSVFFTNRILVNDKKMKLNGVRKNECF